jgi:hypothetical protein
MGALVNAVGLAVHVKMDPQTGVAGPVAEQSTAGTAVHETLLGVHVAVPVTMPRPTTDASTPSVEM